MKMNIRQKGGLLGVLGLAAAVMCCVSFNAFAGATYDWKIPDNVRIVQKGSVDGVRTFSSIQAAINSITDASATNRYLVKVMPGEYNESIRMKSYVDLSGSGQENTKVATAIPDNGVVIMANDSRLENISVENTGDANNTDYTSGILIGPSNNAVIDRVSVSGSFGGIYFGEGSYTITSKVSITNTFTIGHVGYGIRIGEDGLYDVTINNVTAICDGTNPSIRDSYCHGISLWFGNGTATLNATNSTFKASGKKQNAGIVLYGLSNSVANFSNITAIAESGSKNSGIQIPEGKASISNSRAIASGQDSVGVRFDGGLSVNINTSEISGGTFGVLKTQTNQPIKIGTSLIGGSYSGLVVGTDKIVNCHNNDFNSIPDL